MVITYPDWVSVSVGAASRIYSFRRRPPSVNVVASFNRLNVVGFINDGSDFIHLHLHPLQVILQATRTSHGYNLQIVHFSFKQWFAPAECLNWCGVICKIAGLKEGHSSGHSELDKILHSSSS